MPTIYVTLWDPHDREILIPYTYGKAAKRPRKATPLKEPWWRRMLDSWKDLFDIIDHK